MKRISIGTWAFGAYSEAPLDFPVVQGAVLLVAALFLLVSFVVDVLYGRIDPRISVR